MEINGKILYRSTSEEDKIQPELSQRQIPKLEGSYYRILFQYDLSHRSDPNFYLCTRKHSKNKHNSYIGIAITLFPNSFLWAYKMD